MTSKSDAAEMQALIDHITAAVTLLAHRQARYPNWADWRMTTLNYNLARALILASYLRDEVDPEGDAAREGLRERLGHEEGEPDTNR